jgi:hypothetical protein
MTEGAVLLDDVRALVRRFVVLNEGQADAVALWIAHTHAFDAFPCTPYLAVTSAEKRSGKTRLLELLELLARAVLPVVNISDAALFRACNERQPTLLVDEADAIFSSRSPREELRGILNAGYQAGKTVLRMGGGNNTELQEFNVFCPKALAGIDDCLPDTITDRSIPIRLERRTRDNAIDRFRLRDVQPEGHSLRDRLSDWLEPNREWLAASRPDLPDELDDRAQDIWESLLAIADLAQGGWPERARGAALELSTGTEREDDSITARLIRDIAHVFAATGAERFKTSDLLAGLYEIEESPWGEWNGKQLSAQGLSRLLKPYRITTMTVKLDGSTVRGYKIEQFFGAFTQLGVEGVTGVTSNESSHNAVTSGDAGIASQDAGVTADPVKDARSNASNAANEPYANGRPNGRPPVGEDGYLEQLFATFENGQVTAYEWTELSRVHQVLTEASVDDELQAEAERIAEKYAERVI